MFDKSIAKQTKTNVWDIPQTAKEGMRVPARIFASEKLMNDMDDAVFDQLTNVASLPGIVKHALCMPDGHSGYGFPIGGVAAFDPDKDGVISPGGIGFDINCGMRLVTTTLTEKDVQPRIKKLVDTLFNRVPAGVGSKGFLTLTKGQFKDVMTAGSKWCIEQGYGWDEDLAHTEDSGCIPQANAEKVTDRAIQRGITQLGTLGSGNHYLEVQVARNIFDAKTAKQFGITSNDQICVMVHCGSRGFGHQVASDYLQTFLGTMKKYGITVSDPELACAPFRSKEGQDYFAAMACAANAAFANRQVILHRIRECFSKVFNTPADDLGMHQAYDVAHNIAKVEEHKVDGKKKKLVVHRKGATRCFGPGRKELGPAFRDIGQPVILGGSMETGSYLLLGTEKALEETWGSTAHGAGRAMSRAQARRTVRGEQLQKAMEKKGVYVKTASLTGLAEEAGIAYKPVSEVVDVMHKLGISRKVVGFVPLGNVKG
jgi:tRNA-splicing ligase RtcB